jgi:predicted SAM-dependent methyltransferase
MKIEVGSGKYPHSDCTTIDIEPSNHPDIVGDFRTMSFEDIEEIKAYHILEHFGRDEAIKVLKQWYFWLIKGGRLIVEVPDFDRICYYFLNQEKNWAGKEWMVKHIYGSQEADWAYHKDGWYKEKFEKILPEIGFEIELIKQKHSYVKADGVRSRLPNILVIAKKI